jgi:lysophospholipase L1-like esterase
MMKYLALGDSYTCGELVKTNNNFPNQVVQQLGAQDITCTLTNIIAVTGWTTGELIEAIEKEKPSADNDWVTLLIGVNNQYRGQEIKLYEKEFCKLLDASILFASGRASHVIVLSIPDWGMTPFNTKRDVKKVSDEIDAYNKVNKKWSKKMGCKYIDITPLTRKYSKDEEYLTEDKLHLTKKMYTLWANEIVAIITSND